MQNDIPTAIVVAEHEGETHNLPTAESVDERQANNTRARDASNNAYVPVTVKDQRTGESNPASSTGFAPVTVKDQQPQTSTGPTSSYSPVNVKSPVNAVEVNQPASGTMEAIMVDQHTVGATLDDTVNQQSVDEFVSKVKKGYGKYSGFSLAKVTSEELKARCGGKLPLKSSKYESCSFAGSALTEVQFDNSLFRNVDFSGAVLNKVTFQNCVFDACMFEGTQLSECSFNNDAMTGMNFSRATLASCSLRSCSIRGANFSRARLVDCDMGSSAIPSSNFNDARLEKCSISYAVQGSFLRAMISSTSFDYSSLTSLNMSDAELHECSFKYAALGEGIYTNTVFDGCDFTHSSTKKSALPPSVRMTNCQGLSVTKC